ncbi:hypothetical protein BDV93DRAFT_515404 [Ceratobasidium sp. AG-I]|nr:hypothetical protein BDV93DRAFT_515404 [Ceratobasidium sp. AG-I]
MAFHNTRRCSLMHDLEYPCANKNFNPTILIAEQSVQGIETTKRGSLIRVGDEGGMEVLSFAGGESESKDTTSGINALIGGLHYNKNTPAATVQFEGAGNNEGHVSQLPAAVVAPQQQLVSDDVTAALLIPEGALVLENQSILWVYGQHTGMKVVILKIIAELRACLRQNGILGCSMHMKHSHSNPVYLLHHAHFPHNGPSMTSDPIDQAVWSHILEGAVLNHCNISSHKYLSQTKDTQQAK